MINKDKLREVYDGSIDEVIAILNLSRNTLPKNIEKANEILGRAIDKLEEIYEFLEAVHKIENYLRKREDI